MTKRIMAFVSVVLTGTIAAAGLWAASHLPGQLPLPVHWNLSGEPDQFASKWVALLLPSVLACGLSTFFYFLPRFEPRADGLARSEGLYLSAWAGTLIVSALLELAVISVAFRWSLHGTTFILLGVGALLGLIGNQLGKSRGMYLIGFRTPWTLGSEEVWIKTNRLAGKLMVCAGLLFIGAAMLRLPSGLIAAILGVVIVIVLGVPFGYSYLLWRRLHQHV